MNLGDWKFVEYLDRERMPIKCLYKISDYSVAETFEVELENTDYVENLFLFDYLGYYENNILYMCALSGGSEEWQ